MSERLVGHLLTSIFKNFDHKTKIPTRENRFTEIKFSVKEWGSEDH